jgi:hypothetical protein
MRWYERRGAHLLQPFKDAVKECVNRIAFNPYQRGHLSKPSPWAADQMLSLRPLLPRSCKQPRLDHGRRPLQTKAGILDAEKALGVSSLPTRLITTLGRFLERLL